MVNAQPYSVSVEWEWVFNRGSHVGLGLDLLPYFHSPRLGITISSSLCVLPRLPGAPITKRRVQHKPHECLNPTSVSKQRCRDSCGLSSSFVGARYGKNRITRHTKLTFQELFISLGSFEFLEPESWNQERCRKLSLWKWIPSSDCELEFQRQLASLISGARR